MLTPDSVTPSGKILADTSPPRISGAHTAVLILLYISGTHTTVLILLDSYYWTHTSGLILLRVLQLLILLYMCPHTSYYCLPRLAPGPHTVCVLIPHTTIYMSPYLILLYTPVLPQVLTLLYVSSYRILLYTSS